ncbi:hypothetical protein WA577_000313 [Blastocystis sp. JDR]
MGKGCFVYPKFIVFENLPKLRELALEEYCFIGGKDNTNVLKMKNLENLTTITSKGSSFCYTKEVDLENMPNLTTVELSSAFYYVSEKIVSNAGALGRNKYLQ